MPNSEIRTKNKNQDVQRKPLLLKTDKITQEMAEVLDSTENSAIPSRVMTIQMWDQQQMGKTGYAEMHSKTRKTRNRNLKKLQSYSKNIA